MAKFAGYIGFARQVEEEPGVYIEEIVEKKYYGDMLSRGRRYNNGNSVNGSLTILNEISIIADPFASENYFNMRYVNVQGVNWVVDSVKIAYPRLILSLGEVYNGNPIRVTKCT